MQGPASRLLQFLINSMIYLRHLMLVCRFRAKIGRFPNVAIPVSASEKFLWRKIFDRNPLFPVVSDKLLAKKYAAQKCPDVLIPDVLWEGKDFDAVPSELLNSPAVLKSNHASGQIMFLRETPADRKAIKATTVKWLARPYGRTNGEWGYLDIDRKLFLEQLIEGTDGKPLEDFNVYVFNGKVNSTQCLRHSYGPNPTTTRYDRDGNELEAHTIAPFIYKSVEPPSQYPQIVAAAERLGAGFDHIRCDFYLCDSTVYFCEMTVYAIAGFPLEKGVYGAIWRQAWDLRQSWFLTMPQSGLRGRYAGWLRQQLSGLPD